MEPDESKEFGEALNACLATLPASKLVAFDKLVTKWLPWVSLATVGINITVPRVQQTRHEMARLKAEQNRRAALERGDYYETVRTPRADQGAPLDNHQAATVAATTGLVAETLPIGPFGSGQADDGAPGGHGDSDGDEPTARLFG